MTQKGKFEPAKKGKQSALPFQNTEWAIVEDELSNMLSLSNESFEAFFDVGDTGNTKPKVENGVAHIALHGPLFKYSNILTLIGIGTSFEEVTAQFESAMEDGKVEKVVLDVDSPGGQVSGTNKFCDLIYNARGKKPVVAQVNGNCCSAAYWVASAADKIYASDETDSFGSIGVIFSVTRGGNDEYVITSSNAPNKNPDPSTKKGRDYYTSLVDKYAEIFEERVARNRNVDLITVKNDFGKGGILLAKDAIKAGMIDEINDNGGNMTITLESLKKDHPELVQAIEDEAKKTVTDENAKKVTDLEAKVADLEAKLKEAGQPPKDDLPKEAQEKIDAYQKRVEALEQENLKAQLNSCSEEQQKMLIGMYGKVEKDTILAVGKEIERLQGLINKVGGPQGSDETVTDDDLDAKIAAKMAEVKKENPNISETDAYIEAHKQCVS